VAPLLLFRRVNKGPPTDAVWCSEREVIQMKERMQQSRKLGPGLLDPCVHVSGKGFRVPGYCFRNHECWHCAFDQWIELIEEAATAGCHLPDDRRVLARAA
jgi:hypothetical protein